MNKNKRPKFIMAVALVTALLLINFIYFQVKGGTKPAPGAAFTVNPIQRLGYALNDQVEKAIDFYAHYDGIRKENETLKKTIAANEEKLRNVNKVEQENVKLRAMFEYKNRKDAYKYVGANVINRSVNGLTPSYTLDKGSNDGISKGFVVITYEGLAGQITEVYPNHCILETISSENVQVSVVSAGNNSYEGILSGATILGRANMSVITELSLDAPIKAGDDITTSGIGGFYPPNIYVGKIESVGQDPGRLMKTAVVKPVVKFEGGEQFFIVMPKNPQEKTY